MGLCYNQRIETFTESGQFVVTAGKCNGWVAVNIGDVLCFINNIPIKPPLAPNLSGESTGIQGNEGEIFIGTNGVIPVIFDNAAGGVNPKIMIIEKFYI